MPNLNLWLSKPEWLNSGSGSIVQSNVGNIILNGTGGNNNTDNRGLFVSSGADVTSTGGNIQGTSRGGNGTSGNRGISVTGNGTSISSDTGGINLTGIAGGGTFEGININTTATTSIQASTSGAIQLRTPNILFVGASGSIRALGTATILLIAGVDVILDFGSTVSTNSGNLTLVVDNNFPTPFSGLGPGAFILQLGSGLTSGGELRIYTSRQIQNTVNTTINGTVFIPGTFDVDSSTEQWSTYFPAGTYGGANFKLYYKNPIILPPDPPLTPSRIIIFPSGLFFQNIAANLVQLADLLPLLKTLRAPSHIPNYHSKICSQGEEEKECAPTFSPYGSFIFEDDVWWVGESF